MQNSDKYDINLMCECLNVSRSGFYRFFYASSGTMKEKKLSACMRILSIHASDPLLGAPRIALLLHGEGIQIAQSTVSRYMKEMGIAAATTQKRFRPKRPKLSGYHQQGKRSQHHLHQYRLDHGYNIYPHKGRLGLSIHDYRPLFTHGHSHENGLFNGFQTLLRYT